MSVAQLNEVFRSVFGEEIAIRPEMTAKDVAAWDSFNHINLIIAIEEAFDVKFTNREIVGMSKVGDLVDILQRKGCAVSWDS